MNLILEDHNFLQNLAEPNKNTPLYGIGYICAWIIKNIAKFIFLCPCVNRRCSSGSAVKPPYHRRWWRLWSAKCIRRGRAGSRRSVTRNRHGLASALSNWPCRDGGQKTMEWETFSCLIGFGPRAAVLAVHSCPFYWCFFFWRKKSLIQIGPESDLPRQTCSILMKPIYLSGLFWYTCAWHRRMPANAAGSRRKPMLALWVG